MLPPANPITTKMIEAEEIDSILVFILSLKQDNQKHQMYSKNALKASKEFTEKNIQKFFLKKYDENRVNTIIQIFGKTRVNLDYKKSVKYQRTIGRNIE